MPWRDPGWGALGAACAFFKNEKGKRQPDKEALWTILCTESVHLIWKLRCERVIQNDGQEFTQREVTSRWYAAIEHRLQLDRRTAALARGKKDINPDLVERIWYPIIEGARDLPHDWVVDSGVLVGIKRGRRQDN
ncbi:hypothetical protein DICSQDRAFT_69877 [Dichomitus squalens LYAD-421 SS1]|uniref:Uncharacterized protein n=1 Tax=Dichomitus squalens (strain LYAD-421) TaxID=732165 RepID=R7SMY6_DICSQ|nr:uncharacterized protein DICSQDRAFT_69877 [Dichomitus squalens LYAD-421 SS1]EJF57243.1 hypothetical protein DICSQDRAFT_69877 [Dichomitus squalens LYAD-421 SS1]